MNLLTAIITCKRLRRKQILPMYTSNGWCFDYDNDDNLQEYTKARNVVSAYPVLSRVLLMLRLI